MKKIIKGSLIVIVALYLILFISYKNGYYEHLNQEKTIMTEEMIAKYEQDLANGVDVSKENYVIQKNNYSSAYTRISLKTAKKVENLFDSVIKFLFRKLNAVVGDDK